MKEIFKKKARNKLISTGVIILGILLAALLTFLVLDWQSRSNFEKYDKEAAKLVSLITKSDGVTKVQTPGGMSTGTEDSRRGDGLQNTWKYCGIDVDCPESSKSALVQIPRGHEGDAIESLWKLSGYTNDGYTGFVNCSSASDGVTCYSSRHNAKFYVHISLEPADPYHHGAPVEDDGKSADAWRYVTISVKQTK